MVGTDALPEPVDTLRHARRVDTRRREAVEMIRCHGPAHFLEVEECRTGNQAQRICQSVQAALAVDCGLPRNSGRLR